MLDLSKPLAIGRTAEVYPWQADQVLKLFLPWVPEDWITHELRVSRLVEAAGLPAPKVIGEIIVVDGRRGICYQRLQGPSMLEQIQSNPLSIFKQFGLLGKLHAQIHSLAGTGLPSQRKKLQYKIKDAELLPEDLKVVILEALDELPDGDRVCHGDFHPGNILMTEQGPNLIDWTDAACGNPLADVARSIVLLSCAQVPTASLFGWLLKFTRKNLIERYKQHYSLISWQINETQLRAWIPIVAAARLNERIPQENHELLRLVKQGLNKKKQNDAYKG